MGKRDEDRDRIYLIAYIVRIGPMDFREENSKRDGSIFSESSVRIFNFILLHGFRRTQKIRRPWGIGACDMRKMLKIEGPITPSGKEEQVSLVPF